MTINLQFLKESSPFTYWKEISDFHQAASKEAFWSGSEVHIWMAPLDIPMQDGDKLTSEEKRMANRFRNQKDQHYYTASHSILRIILAAYCACEATDLKLMRSKYGKPFLLPEYGMPEIQFNMTHSEGVACYAVSFKREIGVDLEYLNSSFDWSQIAEDYFTEQEKSYLASVLPEEQARAFFQLWTQKESLLKAYGTGLSSIDELTKEVYPSIFTSYYLFPFTYGHKYQGALAVNHRSPSIQYFQFSASNNQAFI